MTSTVAYSSSDGKSSPRSSNLTKAVNDLRDGLNAWELWGTLGWHDLRQRYRRSTFGPFWLTLSMGIMAAAIGVLYAEIFGQPIHDYLPFLAVGLIVWGFISTSIIDACYVFILSEGVIRQVRAPLSVHVYRVVWRNLIVLAHNMVIYVIILVVFGIWPGATILLFIPSLLLLSISAFSTGLLIGLLSARFRDLPPIIANMTQILFLFTPILWRTDQLTGSRRLLAQLNPLYYIVEVMRMPLLGQAPPASSWISVIVVVALSCAITFWFYVRFRARIAYWI
jgi:ABC-2 type transport system permease protein/lipopolysaccharide transport system permease protein